jgi:hypothetical protein
MVPFSVTRTVLMISNGFIVVLFGQTLLHPLEGAPGEKQLVKAQNIIRIERVTGCQYHPRKIA